MIQSATVSHLQSTKQCQDFSQSYGLRWTLKV